MGGTLGVTDCQVWCGHLRLLLFRFMFAPSCHSPNHPDHRHKKKPAEASAGPSVSSHWASLPEADRPLGEMRLLFWVRVNWFGSTKTLSRSASSHTEPEEVRLVEV